METNMHKRRVIKTIDRTDIVKKEFPDTLKKHMGIISHACKAAGIRRSTYYQWRDHDPDFKDACMEAFEERKDHVESKLLKKIDDDDTTAIIFYLKTQAKDRGYVEKQVLEHAGSSKHPIKLQLLLPKEQLDEVMNARYEDN
jgi:hypothetical protein